MEEIECGGTIVYGIPDLLNKDQCDEFIKMYEPILQIQSIRDWPEASQKLWEYIGEKLSKVQFRDLIRNRAFKIVGLKGVITTSKNPNPLRRHIDHRDDGDFFKLSVYLNKLSSEGGTEFYDKGERVCCVSNEIGKAIVFDLSLEHCSENFQKGQVKYVIGVRPVIAYTGQINL